MHKDCQKEKTLYLQIVYVKNDFGSFVNDPRIIFIVILQIKGYVKILKILYEKLLELTILAWSQDIKLICKNQLFLCT